MAETTATPSAASMSGAKGATARWVAMAVLGLLGFLAFLSFAAGARLDAATAGLVVGAGALVFSLATLFKMVQALARPGRTLAPRARQLAGADRAQLREEKRRLLRALNELKFDYEMGKLSEADFTEVKQTYELRAVEVMRQLDGAAQAHPEVYALLEDRGLGALVPEDAAKEESEGDDEPAAEVEETSAQADAETKVEPEPEPESEQATATCEACGGSNDADAKFCKHCGKELSA